MCGYPIANARPPPAASCAAPVLIRRDMAGHPSISPTSSRGADLAARGDSPAFLAAIRVHDGGFAIGLPGAPRLAGAFDTSPAGGKLFQSTVGPLVDRRARSRRGRPCATRPTPGRSTATSTISRTTNRSCHAVAGAGFDGPDYRFRHSSAQRRCRRELHASLLAALLAVAGADADWHRSAPPCCCADSPQPTPNRMGCCATTLADTDTAGYPRIAWSSPLACRRIDTASPRRKNGRLAVPARH